MTAFGDLIDRAMQAKKLTVRDFAKLVKSGKSTVNSVILGGRTPPMKSVDKWCDALDIPAEQRQRYLHLAALTRIKPPEIRSKIEEWYLEHESLMNDYVELERTVRVLKRAAEK